MPSLPPVPPSARKQNIACDQCRAKKIRCLRGSKTETCEQCNNRGSECTSNYIDSLAQAKGKKPRKSPAPNPNPNPIHDTSSNGNGNGNGHDEAPSKKRRRRSEQHSHSHSSERDPRQDGQGVASVHESDKRSRSSTAAPAPISNEGSGESSHRGSVDASVPVNADDSLLILDQMDRAQWPAPAHASLTSHSAKQRNLLRYLFSPYAVTSLESDYTDLSSIRLCQEGLEDLYEEDGGNLWVERPSEAHSSLDDDGIREWVNSCSTKCSELTVDVFATWPHSLAEDFVETFFSLVHPRQPALDDETFRLRYLSPDTHPSGPIPIPLLAVVIGWGARLSDHPAIVADREECSRSYPQSGENVRQKSGMASKIIVRVREVVESSRIIRIPTLENAQTLMYLESLLGQQLARGPTRYQRPYLSAAVQHLLALGYNTPTNLLKITDEKRRQQAVHLWWCIIMLDGFTPVFYRFKPCLNDEDYAIDSEGAEFSNVENSQTGSGPDKWGHSVDVGTWLSAGQSIASLCRSLCGSLWIPRTACSGIPLAALRDFVHRASLWRDAHLAALGAPVQWPDSWDFLRAITACTTDCYHHTLWLVVNRAVEEYGVAEERGPPGAVVEVESIRRRLQEESEHAAMRVAALTGVLTENGYLKLDPLLINHPIYEAGLYLATRGRHEYLICIAGLRQYSLSFPALWEQADELDRIYAATTTGLGPESALALAMRRSESVGAASAAVGAGGGGRTPASASVSAPTSAFGMGEVGSSASNERVETRPSSCSRLGPNADISHAQLHGSRLPEWALTSSTPPPGPNPFANSSLSTALSVTAGQRGQQRQRIDEGRGDHHWLHS